MKLTNIVISGFILALTYSCTEQRTSKSEHIEANQPLIGKIVTALHPNSNLMYQDSKNNYWFASKEEGVYKYDGEKITLFTSKDGIRSYAILSIQEDQSGKLYFDTPEGIFSFDDQSFATLEVAANDSAITEWKSTPNDLWFRKGWDSRGPYKFDGEKLYQFEFPKNPMEKEFYKQYPNVSYSPYGIYSIFKDNAGNTWFGTACLGIYRFDGDNVSWMYDKQLTDTPEGGSFGIRSFAEDKDGFLWMCNTNFKYKILPLSPTKTGIQLIDFQREKGITDQQKQLPYFLSMITDKNGAIWMVSFTDGVWCNNGNEVIHYPIKEKGLNISLGSIYEDRQGMLWIRTLEDGSYFFNGSSFEQFKFANHSSLLKH